MHFSIKRFRVSLCHRDHAYDYSPSMTAAIQIDSASDSEAESLPLDDRRHSDSDSSGSLGDFIASEDDLLSDSDCDGSDASESSSASDTSNRVSKSRKYTQSSATVSGQAFIRQRDALTAKHFTELNGTVFSGQLDCVSVTWNKRLLTTAGMAKLSR